MQPTLFRYAMELPTKIKFPCVVNGIGMTATVTHKEDSGPHTLYHVTFGDGHKDSYMAGEKVLQEGFGRTKTLDAYEDAIYNDMAIMPGLLKQQRTAYVRVGEEGGGSYNVWIIEANGLFKVYYKGMYQFTLRRTHRWEVREGKKNAIINLRMAALISDYIDKHHSGLFKSATRVA